MKRVPAQPLDFKIPGKLPSSASTLVFCHYRLFRDWITNQAFFNHTNAVPRISEPGEMSRRHDLYISFTEEELKGEGLVSTYSMREHGLLASF